MKIIIMDHGDDMPGLGGMGAPSPMNNGTGMLHDDKMMMMHMTFFWGKNAEVLFDGWPGTGRPGMYALALAFVFVLGFVAEWLSHCQLIRPGTPNLGAGLVQSFMHVMRVGLAYLVMLTVMSFNGGVFLAAVAGHFLGFSCFGSRAFKKSPAPPAKSSDLPPMSC